MNKQVVQAVTVGMAGVALASVSVSGASATSEQTPTEDILNAENVEGVEKSEIDLPKVASMGEMLGNYSIREGVCYFSTLGFNIIASTTEESVQVERAQIGYKDEDEEYNLIGEIDGGEGVIPLNSGVNTPKLIVRYLLSDESIVDEDLSTILPELIDVVSYVQDTDAPKVSFEEFTGEKAKSGNITKNGNLVFNVEDNLLIDESRFLVKDGDSRLDASYVEGKLSVPTAQLDNGDHELSITAYDECSNGSTIKYSLGKRTSTPPITGSSHSGAKCVGGVTYIKTTLSVSIDGSEDSSIQNISLLKDGVEIQEITGGAFTISTPGTYSVRVTDTEGNATTYGLEDLFTDLGSRVVVDGELPTANFKLNGTDVTDTWYTGATSGVIHVEDNAGIDRIQTIVNGNDVSVGCNGATSYDLTIDFVKDIPHAADGEYRVDYTVYDNAGNIFHETHQFRGDFDDPTIENVTVKGVYADSEGTIYAKGNLVIDAKVKDIGSGVQSVDIQKDGVSIGSSFPFTITEDGSYTFQVTDRAGRKSKLYSLGDLVGSDSQGSVVIDGNAPVVTKGLGFEPDLESKGNWYKTEPTFSFTVEDANLKDVEVSINGKHVNYTNDGTSYMVSGLSYIGKCRLSIVAEDMSGNRTVVNYDYNVDKDAPDNVSASVSTKFSEKFGKLFFKKTPELVVTAEDAVGVGRYILDEESSTTGKFVLSEGVHFIRVEDKLGNSTKEVNLCKLLGTGSAEEIIVDSESPVINCKHPEGDANGWYADDIIYTASINDDRGIYSYSATINGKEVASYRAGQHGITTKEINIDTRDVDPASNGSYSVYVEVEDNAGNTAYWSDMIYIDREPPKVDKFVFTGNGNFEGVNIDGKDRYGFFFNGKAKCAIHVSDGTVSSGIDSVHATLISDKGGKTIKTLKVSGGVASIDIPNGFRGMIEAYAVDNVQNKGLANRPDGVVSEDSNCHLNNVSIDIDLPQTSSKDVKGNNLYKANVSATAKLGCMYSGVQKIEWGINEETKGAVDVSINGTISGNSSSIISKDKNLIVDLSQALDVDSNTNDIKLWVKITDRAGHVSEEFKTLSIDKDAPELVVTYDINEGDGYYNQNRTANIAVKERNFDPALFKLSGKHAELGSWVNSGDVWRNTIVFSKDGDYQFSASVTDMAGNEGTPYNSEKFTIDKTAPILNVSWDNNSSANGNFYNKPRTATVTVVEHNFSADRVKLEGSGSLSGWSSSGDTHRATMIFAGDGEYEFTISCTDLADNASSSYSEPKFIIDTTPPVLTIEGVENGISYKKNVGFSVSVSDSYLNKDTAKVSLVGRKNGEITINQSVNEATGMFELSAFPEEEDFDDLYTLSADVSDMAGNTVSNSIVFSLNRFGSKYVFLESDLLGNYINKARDVTITERNVDKLDISKARIAVLYEGKELPVDSSLLAMSESGGEKDAFDYTYRVSSKAFAEDGKYSVQIYSKAIEGTDYSSISEVYEFVLDTKKPDIVISGIESGGRYKEYQKRVMIDVRDMSGVKDIKVSINGKDVPVDKSDGIYSVTVSESSEVQEMLCTVTDLAGNIANKKVDDVLISSNIVDYVIHQSWFRYVAYGVGALLLAIIIFLIKLRSDSRKREKVTMQEHETMYKETSSSSLGSGSSEAVSKDVVEELDVEYSDVTSSTDLEN